MFQVCSPVSIALTPIRPPPSHCNVNRYTYVNTHCHAEGDTDAKAFSNAETATYTAAATSRGNRISPFQYTVTLNGADGMPLTTSTIVLRPRTWLAGKSNRVTTRSYD